MIGFLASLLGSKTGRTAVLVLLALASAAVAVWRIYGAGRANEKAKNVQASLDNLRKRVKSDDQIAELAPDERRRRLAEWMRDGGR